MLSVIACVITFSIKAIVNRMDPFADEDGNLPADFAADGIHMYSEQNKKLMNYIISHAFAS